MLPGFAAWKVSEDFLAVNKPTYQEMERSLESLENELGKREQTDEALRKNEEKYRTFFEESRDAILITTIDGTFVDINQAALDLFCYTRNELMPKNVRELYANPQERVNLQRSWRKRIL